MLYSIIVNFKAQNEAVIPPTVGYYAYALFLDMMKQANSAVAQRLHDEDSTKPFTISPLQGKFQRRLDGIKLSADNIYWIRLTFLREDVFAHFMDAAAKTSSRTLRLNNALLQISGVLTTPGSAPFCKCTTFESILENASGERSIKMRFLSPAVFRSGGKRNVFFPEPRLLFNSYLAKWQGLSPVKLENSLGEVVDKGVRITQYKLETRILDFGSYREIGFEGNCGIEISNEIAEDTAKALNALADFSFYCGTGAKTTMGMGQTRRMTGTRR